MKPASQGGQHRERMQKPVFDDLLQPDGGATSVQNSSTVLPPQISHPLSNR